MWLGADAPSGDVGDFTNPLTWINFGVLGLMFLAGMTGWLHFKPAVQRLEKEIERLHAEADKRAASHTEELRNLRMIHLEDSDRIRADASEQLKIVRDEKNRALEKVEAMADVYQTSLLPSLNKFLTTIEILMPLLQRVAERPGGDRT